MAAASPEDLEARLEYHLRMEELLLQVARQFLQLGPEDDATAAMDRCLERVGEFTGVDRCYLYLIDHGRAMAERRHLWVRDGTPTVTEDRSISMKLLTEAMSTMVDGSPVVIADLQEAPVNDELRSLLTAYGVRAIMVAPMLEGGLVEGFLGLTMATGPRKWTAQEVTLARFLAHTFAQTLRRIRDESALRQSEARFTAFLEQNPDAMYVLELSPPIDVTRPEDEQVAAILGARVVQCNRAGARYFGREDATGLVGLPFGEAFAGTDEQVVALLREDTRNFVRNGYQIRIDETPWVTPEGEHIWVARSAHGVVEDGKLSTVWASARDITEQKRTRDEREEMGRRLQQAERLESVGLLAGGIAHDFNNLLLAILGNADLAALRPDDPDRVKDCLAEIRRAGQRAAELTRQLLAFSRRQPTVKAPVDLNSLLGSAHRMLARLLPETIELDFIPGHDLGIVMADEAQVEQMMLNLCINARDAMSDAGGRLTIETQNVRINGEYCRSHPWAKPGRYVLITVADTGKGIREEDLPHVFEPFFTTKGPGHGTGLGLATVYGIVQQHGGMVHVYSETNVGTTFKVYLPITEQQARRVGTEVRAAPPKGNETVLLAEDEEQVRNVASRILERAGYEVLAVADGAEAVEAFDASPEAFDVVLLDVVMPGLNGREARDRIRQIRDDVPILFSSGYTGTVLDGVDLNKLGAPVLHKPYDPDELLVALRGVLDRD